MKNRKPLNSNDLLGIIPNIHGEHYEYCSRRRLILVKTLISLLKKDPIIWCQIQGVFLVVASFASWPVAYFWMSAQQKQWLEAHSVIHSLIMLGPILLGVILMIKGLILALYLPRPTDKEKGM